MNIKKIVVPAMVFSCLATAFSATSCGSKEWWFNVENLTSADIGKIQEVKLNDVIHKVRLIGIDQDANYQGNTRVHTTWEFVNLISDHNGYCLGNWWDVTPNSQVSPARKSGFNNDYTNSTLRRMLDLKGGSTNSWYQVGGTSESDIGTEVFNMLPVSLREVIKSVSKYVQVKTNTGESGVWRKTEFAARLFPLSAYEMNGIASPQTGMDDDGPIYEYYQQHSDPAAYCKTQVKTVNIEDRYICNGDIESAHAIAPHPTDAPKQDGDTYNLAGITTNNGKGIYMLRNPYRTNNYSINFVDGLGSISANAYTGNDVNAMGVAPAFCI